MIELFDHIIRANTESSDIQGIMYGIVADVDDPLKLQRVQVYDQTKGGIYKSDWMLRGLPFTSFSPPVPRLGDLVIFGYIMGDPHQGCYLGVVVNNVNKPVGDDKDFTIVLGGATVSIRHTTGDVSVTTTGSVSVKGARVTIDSEGDLTFKASAIKYQAPEIDFGNPDRAVIAGKSVVTLGGKDNAGNTIISKGW